MSAFEIVEADYSIFLKDDSNCITCNLNIGSSDIVLLTAILDMEIFFSNEWKIYELINEIMTRTGVVGRMVSLEDNFWQNTIDIDDYVRANRSLEGIPLKKHPVFNGQKAVDVERLPGYEEQIGNIWVGAAWKMWFNKFYYQFVSQESIWKF